MDKKWTQLDPPTTCPAPLPVRGMACLARSEHPAFPETVPYAVESVPGFAPNHRLSPESAGRLAREIMENELGRYPALTLKNFPIHSRRDFSRFIEAMSLVRHGYEGGVALRDQANDGVNVASTGATGSCDLSTQRICLHAESTRHCHISLHASGEPWRAGSG